MHQSKAAIICTLSYSDIFDYPLTRSQLWRYIISNSDSRIKMSEFENEIKSLLLENKIIYKDSFFLLKGRNGLIKKRKKRLLISKKKFIFAQEICAILSLIPTIDFIGLSGSLSMQNADKNADIDLFIITKPQTLWVTRLMVLIILQLKKTRRKRDSKKTKDMVCVNMLIDSDHLAFPKSRQNIYVAHEIVQMRPIFSRNFTYEKFLKKNLWIKKNLYNSFPTTMLGGKIISKKNGLSFLSLFEELAKFVQIWYMKKHITKEIIYEGFVAFHPLDYKDYVISQWEKRKKKYGI